MPITRQTEAKSYHNKDLVLRFAPPLANMAWNEDKYEAFIDALCGDREYQKDAIKISLRYLIGGGYANLRALAKKNFEDNEYIADRYGTWENMQRQLQLPDLLAGSLDLATGTGKSYVLYGVAAIMLAEGIIDRVLVLCPSTTIEDGLLEKFRALVANADLRDLLPEESIVTTPRIINAHESIVKGSICVENYHAILEHVGSSIRDTLTGKGKRTLVLNDEAHHVANEPSGRIMKWKEFLQDPNFNFRYVLGVSGTCYVDNDYFSDVIYRYSLQTAMEQGFVKKVHYIAEAPNMTRPEHKWQLVINKHEEIRKEIKPHNIRPLTIVVTPTIRRCGDVAEELKAMLIISTGLSAEKINERVLVIHSGAADLSRLSSVNSTSSKVEWIVSVSMLTEGWDVKRVFQIVPHEEKAFNSKLLIAQVLGRGLRVPDNWKGPQPQVTVFNHDAWAARIRHLVDEVMEFENRIPTFPIAKSDFNFDLLNIKYDPTPYTEKYPMTRPYKLFADGFVDLATETPIEHVGVEFIEADTGRQIMWRTQIRHETYTPQSVALDMYDRFEDVESLEDRKFYKKNYPPELLEAIVVASLKRRKIKVLTDGIRQKFLQSLGTLHRTQSHIVRYKFEAAEYTHTRTEERNQETVSASELKNYKTLFFTDDTISTIPAEYLEFYKIATEQASGYMCFPVRKSVDFKSSLNAVIADHDNERKFIRDLITTENAEYVDAWMKSVSMSFYEIDYAWKKGRHQKRGKFNPDFFLKIGDQISVIEIKDDDEIHDPAPENFKKSEYALNHFNNINDHLKREKQKQRYCFNFLTPSDFPHYFQSIRDSSVQEFKSKLDIRLAAGD